MMDFSPCYAEAKKLVGYSMDRLKGFSVLDFGIFKTCLISFGILIGARFAKFLKKFEIFVLLTFIASFIFLVYRVFVKPND